MADILKFPPPLKHEKTHGEHPPGINPYRLAPEYRNARMPVGAIVGGVLIATAIFGGLVWQSKIYTNQLGVLVASTLKTFNTALSR